MTIKRRKNKVKDLSDILTILRYLHLKCDNKPESEILEFCLQKYGRERTAKILNPNNINFAVNDNEFDINFLSLNAKSDFESCVGLNEFLEKKYKRINSHFSLF